MQASMLLLNGKFDAVDRKAEASYAELTAATAAAAANTTLRAMVREPSVTCGWTCVQTCGRTPASKCYQNKSFHWMVAESVS